MNASGILIIDEGLFPGAKAPTKQDAFAGGIG